MHRFVYYKLDKDIFYWKIVQEVTPTLFFVQGIPQDLPVVQKTYSNE